MCWHRQLGRMSLVWGGMLGTLPDLDVIVYPFLDEVQRLYWHRGESHSIWFAIFGGLVFGFAFFKHLGRNQLSIEKSHCRDISGFCHSYNIDYFTVYGTQLLAPISRYGFARGNMFIVDVLYTIPLLSGVIVAGAVKGKIGWRVNAQAYHSVACMLYFHCCRMPMRIKYSNISWPPGMSPCLTQ